MERERECGNSVRKRQLCSGDVGFVTWRSSSSPSPLLHEGFTFQFGIHPGCPPPSANPFFPPKSLLPKNSLDHYNALVRRKNCIFSKGSLYSGAWSEKIFDVQMKKKSFFFMDGCRGHDWGISVKLILSSSIRFFFQEIAVGIKDCPLIFWRLNI